MTGDKKVFPLFVQFHQAQSRSSLSLQKCLHHHQLQRKKGKTMVDANEHVCSYYAHPIIALESANKN